MEQFKGMTVIAVTHVDGFSGPNVQELIEEKRKVVEARGGAIVTASHSF